MADKGAGIYEEDWDGWALEPVAASRLGGVDGDASARAARPDA